jgi:hypothetical protein
LWPSFETAARKRARPPQDDAVICCAGLPARRNKEINLLLYIP